MTDLTGLLAYRRTILLALVLIVVSGIMSFFSIAKESAPDVSIPSLYVSVSYEGVSPQDADSLLVKPLQKELETVEGLKEISTVGVQGYANITLEFQSNVDMDQALIDVRELVDRAKPQLPEGADDPRVIAINVALFPILTVGLSGQVERAVLQKVADDLKDRIESVTGVLEVELNGFRQEVVEVIIDPANFQAYELSLDEVVGLIRQNNRTVNSGNIDTGSGRFAVQLPGLVSTIDEILSLPIKVYQDRVITIEDIATVRPTYKDPQSISRINGLPTIQLAVSKRIGSNIIDTVEATKEVVRQAAELWPKEVEYQLFQDESHYISNNLLSLYNNVIFSTLLVMLVILVTLGSRNALLVGFAIPASFLSTILIFNLFGLTLNMVVLFALILSVGMLVDGAIVVSEYADRRMLEGQKRALAYMESARHMAMPIISSTLTTLAVFAPLLFWPDVIGEFMKYIPVTVIITLIASLVMTLLAVPVLGSMIGRPGGNPLSANAIYQFVQSGDKSYLKGGTGVYIRLLDVLLKRPGMAFLVFVLAAVSVVFLYAEFGKGANFFPTMEPERAQVSVRARGNLSIYERDALIGTVEEILLSYDEVRVVSSTTTAALPRTGALDVIGSIVLEFEDWFLRRPATDILEDIRRQTDELAGIVIETKVEESGPPSAADIVVELKSSDRQQLEEGLAILTAIVQKDGAFHEIRDTKPLETIDWSIKVNREEASLLGASIASIGTLVRLVTNGVKMGSYIPDNASEKVDILARFPHNYRNIDQLGSLSLHTAGGEVPLSRFVIIEPTQGEGQISRSEGRYFYRLLADVRPGEEKPASIARVSQKLAEAVLPSEVTWRFRGEQENQKEASSFLMKAFSTALFVMLIILVTQFNSFYQAGLILSAIIFSVFGVFIGLMIRGEPFSIVMSGVGIIALAGIVVNNNIILIDTYNTWRRKGVAVRHAILCTGAQRLRPVALTSVTTIIGLLPMVLQLNIDIVNRQFTVNEPTSQLWVQLASAIAGGLAFAVPLTLLLTPCLLYIRDRKKVTEPLPVHISNAAPTT